MIRVEHLAKSFGAVVAVSSVSFTAEDGEITTLLGANGSGKTTTLRAVAGLLKADGGSVFVDGVAVADDPLAAQARLGVFPDNFGLYTRLTAREHLRYFAELHGMQGTTLDEAVEYVATQLRMQDILDRRTEGFSQGQRMKVALGRAIIHRPKNIIFDEPSRGLDVISVRLLRRILLDLRAAGHCVLLSSHVMAEVHRLSDRVVIMSDGRVCAEGTPDALIDLSGEDNLEEAFVTLAGLPAEPDTGLRAQA